MSKVGHSQKIRVMLNHAEIFRDCMSTGEMLTGSLSLDESGSTPELVGARSNSALGMRLPSLSAKFGQSPATVPHQPLVAVPLPPTQSPLAWGRTFGGREKGLPVGP